MQKTTAWICLAIFLAMEWAHAAPCDDAKEWLKGVNQGGVGNSSDAWNQLKPWVSGNESSCRRSLVNETSRDDEADDEQLSDTLRKYVFKDVTHSQMANKRRPCGGKRPKNNARRPPHRKRNKNGAGHQTTNGIAVPAGKEASTTKKA
ncbi:hypothetical protein JTE90_014957 [Oedothorax gibbosus]|uniref:Uncharacterized protein n=1 Tax=Oedothorax gibbosus TaxID=931172 RepID=A0AAV6UWR9_9ARAC|nr:hypothetical protein JTE90_014957 [Oedothorax gibbosus]